MYQYLIFPVNFYSTVCGTPPYDHIANATTFYFPKQHKIKVFFLSKDPVNMTTLLIWPKKFGRTVVVLTGFHCNSKNQTGY